ncbi:MAG: NUDIX hydrolase [Desulfuromonadaceae bacterium]|nr:NUDIX hydrolase [Desulfuromonadaceae bacterium]MDD5104180.1 NUDIX hydrolase [Desulfuromonadaceae bacterium]
MSALAPWYTEASRTILSLKPWLSVIEDTIKLPSGRIVNDYYRIETPDYVLISARRDDGSVLMERHYKQCLRKIILTSPAGGVDEGELPIQAAKRELLEETGFEADNWSSLGSFVVDGTRGICTAHLFSAELLRKVSVPVSNDMEELELLFMSPAEIQHAVRQGDIPLLPDIALLSMSFGNVFLNNNQEKS